jgi:hypothetical protein
MSLLGRQVYANPTTPIWGQGGGGGGGSYPLDASFNSVSFLPPGDPAPYASSKLRLSSIPYGDAYIVGVVDPSNDLGPLQTGGYVEVQDAGPLSTAFSRMLYAWDGIDYQQANSGTSVEFMSLNAGSNGFDLSNISTINGSPPGGGSYPRDASFNSVLVNPSGGVFPLSLGLGTTSNIMGIRRDEEGKEADYILFDPTETSMDLSNVATINGAPYVPTITDTIIANAGAAQVPLSPSRLSLSSNTFTPIADGKLTLTAFANFDSVVSTVANGILYFEIDGTPGASVAWFGASAVGQRASATCCEVLSVSGGTPVDINTVASIADVGTGATGDFEAYESRTLVQFTAL